MFSTPIVMRSNIEPLTIVIVGTNFGFPFGKGAASRVRLICLGLKANGAKVNLLHLNCSEKAPDIINFDAKGNYRGIDFEYTTGATVFPRSFFYRHWLQLKGLFLGLWRLARLRYEGQSCCVYLYERFFIVSIPVIFFCRLIGLPVVLDICEWWPIFSNASRTEKMIFLNYTLGHVDGVVAISGSIFEKVSGVYNERRLSTPILKVPILVDNGEWQVSDTHGRGDLSKYILWSGDLKCYMSEVKFLMRVMPEILDRNKDVKLRLVGMVTPSVSREIRDYHNSLGIPEDYVEFAGYLKPTEIEFRKQISGATALLLPMEGLDKDLFRFPHKLGEYLASGRPVVASDIGEVSRFLKNGVNAVLCKQGDVKSFADGVESLLRSPEYAERIGKEGRRLSEITLDYRAHGLKMTEFIHGIMVNKRNSNGTKSN